MPDRLLCSSSAVSPKEFYFFYLFYFEREFSGRFTDSQTSVIPHAARGGCPRGGLKRLPEGLYEPATQKPQWHLGLSTG